MPIFERTGERSLTISGIKAGLQKPLWATLIGCAAIAMWSLLALLVMQLQNLPVFEILALSFSVSFIATIIWLTSTQRWSCLRQPWWIWMIGIVGIFGNDLTYIAAFKYAPAVQADLINNTWPILVILLSTLLPKEKFTFKHVIAAILGFVSIYLLIIGVHGLADFKMQFMPGYLLAFADAVIWAGYTVLSRYYGNTPVEMIGMYCGVGALFSFGLHAGFEPNILPSLWQWAVLLLMGLTTSGAAYFCWDHGVKRGHFKLLSIFSYAIPIVSFALLVLVGRSAFRSTWFISCLFVVAGALVGGVQWRLGFAALKRQLHALLPLENLPLFKPATEPPLDADA